ncbi:MAG: hypothetical protein DYG92_05870 [Leptolyngbya sp. PLA1]|nr:hypothetical protein [Leptolyngbya sp. PLA1]
MNSNLSARAGRWVVLLLMILACWPGESRGQVAVYSHAQYPTGGQYKSAWYAPDGLDSDENVWDAFTLPADAAITEVRWRGAYTNYLSGAGLAPVYDFSVAIYSSIAGGSQPNVVNGRLVRYYTGSNAGETPAGQVGGVNMYDYHFTLPSAFQAQAGVKYWLQIIASQGLTPTYYWPPDWSWARGTGGDASHFRRVGGTGGMFHFITGDCTFTLFASSAPTFTISASASPPEGGVISGAGSYPSGSNATLTANPAAGFGFVRWAEGGAQVSGSRVYTFPVTANRSLVAEFTPAFDISVAAFPTYGGSATGGGVFNQGASVTVTAAPLPGFVFAEWQDWGTPVSTSPVYTFAADSDRSLRAVFVHDAKSTTFTIDDGPVHTSLPTALQSDGLGMLLTGAYSIQPAGTLGFTPAGFEGLCVYPNSVFREDLTAEFSEALTYFSMLYSPQELACDDSARMRVTAFLGAQQVGTATTTLSTPGTWPTGRLSISVPGGFDRAVVHYDAPPPTCQDYGVIFLADNITVTRLGPTACDPDVNQDGNVDQDDVSYLINVVGGGDNPTGIDPDFNLDGNVDQDDVAALIDVVAGGACP